VADGPPTREPIKGRDQYIRIQREYPELWGPIQGLRLVGDGRLVAAEVSVPGDGEDFRCSGFYQCRDGLIVRASEYWTTIGGSAPPPLREHWWSGNRLGCRHLGTPAAE